jgi:heme exporter protein C
MGRARLMLLFWAATAFIFLLAVGQVFNWRWALWVVGVLEWPLLWLRYGYTGPVQPGIGTPEEATMGIIQKIFYVHMPVAINTFLACLTVFVSSVGYLLGRRSHWDDLSMAAAKVAVVLCTGVLVTGMFWARGAWGVWWTWSPRLTFSFMLWLLYVVYLLVRASISNPQRRAVVAAVYGVVAFLDVPLVYLSARLLPDIHPGSIGLTPPMQQTLAMWFVPVTLLTFGLIAARYGLARRERAMRNADWDEQEGGHGFPVEPSRGAA